MEKFTLNINNTIGKVDFWCRSRDTRSGFAHDCRVPALGVNVKICYLNRTWERFCFESVIHSAIEKIVSGTMGLRGKKHAKEAERVYKALCGKVDKIRAKGGFKYYPSESAVFGN